MTLPYGNDEWIHRSLDEKGKVFFKKTFTFLKEDLHIIDPNNIEKPIEFIFGTLVDGYFMIKKRVLSIKHNIFIHESIKLLPEFFTSARNISIFGKIDKLINENIYIGGNKENALPESEFNRLINDFPNNYEIEKYVGARLSVVLRDYFDTAIDGEKRYNQYMNKKISQKEDDLIDMFSDSELVKYEIILQKLEKMLKNENKYNEKQWQKEILHIILLIYPKYILAFHEAPVRDTYNNKDRNIDYLFNSRQEYPVLSVLGHTGMNCRTMPFTQIVLYGKSYTMKCL